MPRKPETPRADLPAFPSAFLYRWLWRSLDIHLTSPEIAASVRTSASELNRESEFDMRYQFPCGVIARGSIGMQSVHLL
jgi:hypothetical protein